MKEFLPNEVEKLKTEHARYKKALESICNSVYLTDAHRGAKQALNPPTIDELRAALRELNRKAAKAYDAAAIKFYGEYAQLNFPLTKTI